MVRGIFFIYTKNLQYNVESDSQGRVIQQYYIDQLNFTYSELVYENSTTWTYNATLDNQAHMTIIVSILFYKILFLHIMFDSA